MSEVNGAQTEAVAATSAQAGDTAAPNAGLPNGNAGDAKGGQTGAASAGAGTEPANAAEAAKPVVPEKYDLKASEGSKLPAARLAEIEKEAREQGLTQDAAASLLKREEAVAARTLQAEQDAYNQRATEWANTLKQDPDFGARGAELAHRALERFATPELKEILNSTQLGNHPELARTFKRIGEAMANDSFVAPGAQTSAPQPSAAQRMFSKSV